MSTPEPSDRDEPVHADDTDLALYALGALDDTELRTVETRLATDARAAAVEGRLRRVAGSVAAVADGIDTAPPLDLRDRVLAAARAERPPAPVAVEPTPPNELHRIEAEHLLDLLRSLRPEDWATPVDPPEFAGWTVGDLVAHLATVEAYLARQLGITAPVELESHPVNEDRTAAAITRHRALDPAAAVAELESFVDAVDAHVGGLARPDAEPVVWWGNEQLVDRVLVIRSFELWIHAADIARAVGRPEPVPSAPSLRTMSTLATALTPVMCAIAGTLPADAPPGAVRIDLTGPGGAVHDIDLSLDAVGTPIRVPRATITVDIVDYCRAVANRGEHGMDYTATGDTDLAAAVIAALPALATL